MFRFFSAIVAICLLLLPVNAMAQIIPTNIGLEVSFVTNQNQRKPTNKINPTTWEFTANELTLDDSIRYGWEGVDLDTKYVGNPKTGGGYLKVYKGDANVESNFLFDYGSSPLPISALAQKIQGGPNTITLVYYNYNGRTDTKAQFNFNLKTTSSTPAVKVVSPDPNTVFTPQSKDVEFAVEIKNFSLEGRDSGQPNKGKMNVYYDAKTPQNFLGNFSFSQSLPDNRSIVNFKAADIPLDKIKDNKNTKLIFVLTNGAGTLLEYETTFDIVTNYNNTLNVGLPKITIAEPSKDSKEISVNGQRKFILQIDNFEILSQLKADKAPNTGYLQIFIDNEPIKTTWSKAEFTLDEIDYAPKNEGIKSIRVELRNQDLTALSPKAEDTIDVFYSMPNKETNKETISVDSNNWRVIIIVLVVLVIIGAIAILITRG
jgi:hypothetical protein